MYYKSIEDLEKAFYGDIDVGRLFKKADDNVISGDTAQWNKIYGAKCWSQVNYELNAFAALPKEPWGKTGYRLETASGRTFPSGGIAEGATTTFTAVPETIAGTYALIAPPVKQVVHSWGISDFADVYASVGDDSIPSAQHIETAGKAHARAISAYLVQDCDTPASNGFESVDRVAESYADCQDTTYFSAATDPDIFSLDRSAATTYDAQVESNGLAAGLLRDLTLTLIDSVWSKVTKAGGLPKLILTGYNTIRVWSSLLEAERRYDAFKMAQFVPRFGEAAGVTGGEEVGFSVATYFGVPIIPCQDYDASIATARTNEVAPITMLDTDYVRFAVAKPTQYTESDPADKISIGMGKKGWFETWGELRCYSFAFQGKVRDIK
jgi:hypothetical protein